MIARKLLLPAQQLEEPVRLICREDRPERLVAELAIHTLDVVLSFQTSLFDRSLFLAFHHFQLSFRSQLWPLDFDVQLQKPPLVGRAPSQLTPPLSGIGASVRG